MTATNPTNETTPENTGELAEHTACVESVEAKWISRRLGCVVSTQDVVRCSREAWARLKALETERGSTRLDGWNVIDFPDAVVAISAPRDSTNNDEIDEAVARARYARSEVGTA